MEKILVVRAEGDLCVLRWGDFSLPLGCESEETMTEDKEDLREDFRKRADAKMKGPNPHKPTHTIYYVRDRGEDSKAAWDRIGVAWTNRDGSLSCKFDCVPVDGRFQIRKNDS